MIPLDRRFYADAPCPACGHYGTRAAPSWCYVQEGERRFWCGRVGTYRGMKGTPGKDGQGFSHWFLTLDEAKAAGQLKPRDAARQHQQPRATPARCDPPPVDAEVFREADRQARKRVTAGQVRELADRLGVTCGSLRRLGIGWIGSAVGMKVDRGTGEERRCRGAAGPEHAVPGGTGRTRSRSSRGGGPPAASACGRGRRARVTRTATSTRPTASTGPDFTCPRAWPPPPVATCWRRRGRAARQPCSPSASRQSAGRTAARASATSARRSPGSGRRGFSSSATGTSPTASAGGRARSRLRSWPGGSAGRGRA